MKEYTKRPLWLVLMPACGWKPAGQSAGGPFRPLPWRSCVASSWRLALPPDFQLRLDETVDGLSSCFRRSADLRIAFPRSFDLIEELESLVADIRTGGSHSNPENTALIVLRYAAEILHDLA